MLKKGLPYLSEQIVQAEKKLLELKDIVDEILSATGLTGNSAHNINTSSLTKQEMKILKMVAASKSSEEIAGILKISKRTVEAHTYNMRKKFGSRFNQLIELYRPQLKLA